MSPSSIRSRSGPKKTGADLKREKEVRLIKIAIAVTSVYMLVELVVGYSFQALVLVADAYHMLNDLVAFIVQLYADEIGGLKREAGRESSGFTYGFSRVAFVANLINGVILIALCLTLALESLQRLYTPETMALPPLVAGLGFLALIWNGIMMKMFDDAHEHGSHSLCHPSRFRRRMIDAAISTPNRLARMGRASRTERSLSRSRTPTTSRRAADHEVELRDELAHSNVKEHRSALAIHAATDAAGNIAVILDGLVSVAFGPKIGKVSGLVKPWRGIGFIDPLASLVVTYVILMHSFPLVTASSYALMQAFDPRRTTLLRQKFASRDWLPHPIRSDLEVTLLDLHVWALTKDEQVATLKFEVLGTSHDGRRRAEPSLEDLASIEDAAKTLLAQAKIRREMITVEIVTEVSSNRVSPSSSSAEVARVLARRNSVSRF